MAFRNRLTALYSHGNAEDITQIAPWLRVLSQELGVNFIAYEYPGYSYSASRDSDEPLTPSEKLVFDHADASYKYATETLNIPPNRIVMFAKLWLSEQALSQQLTITWVAFITALEEALAADQPLIWHPEIPVEG
jgi:hypothetical protein